MTELINSRMDESVIGWVDFPFTKKKSLLDSDHGFLPLSLFALPMSLLFKDFF